MYHIAKNQYASKWAMSASSEDGMWQNAPAIEGLMNQVEFDRLDAVDATIQALCKQLPTILTKPLTAQSAEEVYCGDSFRLIVHVDDVETNDNSEDIVVLRGQNDLIALSDVLVLATAAAQQANAAISGGVADTAIDVQLQVILDGSYEVLRIPWKATAPLLGSPNSNQFEGITDFYLSAGPKYLGKVDRSVIRKLSWNGRSLNGPAIGQALKTIQSTVANLQQSPLFRNLIGSYEDRDRTSGFLNALRDGFLDQAASAISSRQISTKDPPMAADETIPIEIIPVDAVGELGWVETTEMPQLEETQSKIPSPGTKEWTEYSSARNQMIQFYESVIPKLSDLSIVDPNLFAENATYQTGDGSILVNGRERLADYFQSLALTRKATGGSWTMKHCKIIDWKAKEVLVDYEATSSSLPKWKVHGSDVYCLADDTVVPDDRIVISKIMQQGMSLIDQNGSERWLDSQWLIKNLANAFANAGSGKASRDFLTELLMQQPGMRSVLKNAKGVSSKAGKMLSQSAAANCYYIMADLLDHSVAVLDISSSRLTPPVLEYMDENVDLRGYLGESILKGKNLYDRSIGSVIFGVRDSIRQKRIAVEKIYPSRVELLMPSGDIRLSQKFLFRIPTPGAGVILPESVSSPPIKIELVSDYNINPSTGLITEHRLVETRVNGQLTPGDQVSRWIRRFLSRDASTNTGSDNGNNDSVLRAITDTMNFFRSVNGEDNI
jgi:hypothetical protein